MSQCAVKRGIITLRDCGAEASDTCTKCARPICQEHTKIRGTEVMCVECFARQVEEESKQQAQGGKGAKPPSKPVAQGDEWDDPTWPYSYRHHYYSTYNYHPFYWGSYYDNYYDGYDLRSFSHRSHDNYDNEDAVGGVYDS
jgi:hypothetical protein